MAFLTSCLVTAFGGGGKSLGERGWTLIRKRLFQFPWCKGSGPAVSTAGPIRDQADAAWIFSAQLKRPGAPAVVPPAPGDRLGTVHTRRLRLPPRSLPTNAPPLRVVCAGAASGAAPSLKHYPVFGACSRRVAARGGRSPRSVGLGRPAATPASSPLPRHQRILMRF